VDNYEERLKHERDFRNNDDWRKNRAHLGKYRSIFTDKKGTTAYRDKIIFERPRYNPGIWNMIKKPQGGVSMRSKPNCRPLRQNRGGFLPLSKGCPSTGR
jgi:hypothetical protein